MMQAMTSFLSTTSVYVYKIIEESLYFGKIHNMASASFVLFLCPQTPVRSMKKI
jgi:hypothetical protein